jgi:RNA polymerase sigma factor (sigma-70 family)
MEDLNRRRHQWIADEILPWEGEVRRWFSHYTSALPADEIDDLIQEAYARLSSVDFTRIRNGRAYLYSIVQNRAQDLLRRARVVQIESIGELDVLLLDEAPGPERWLSARQEYEQVLQALGTLTPRRRSVYQLRKFEELSQKEIGRRLGIEEKTVENLLGLAQAQVMAVMLARGALSDTNERWHHSRLLANTPKRGRSRALPLASRDDSRRSRGKGTSGRALCPE